MGVISLSAMQQESKSVDESMSAKPKSDYFLDDMRAKWRKTDFTSHQYIDSIPDQKTDSLLPIESCCEQQVLAEFGSSDCFDVDYPDAEQSNQKPSVIFYRRATLIAAAVIAGAYRLIIPILGSL